MTFIAITVFRLLGAAMLLLALIGFGALFNLISAYVFSGPNIDMDFSLKQWAMIWGGFYLVTFVIEPG